MASTKISGYNINSSSDFTFANTTVNGNLISYNANLGNAATANFFIGDGGLLSNITVGAGSAITNGNSNVTVDANSNVRISVGGTANVFVVTNLGSNTTGYANVTGNIRAANANLGNLVTANFFQGDGGLLTNITATGGSAITNGTSNVTVDASGNVRTSVAGTANVLVVTSTGANTTGYANVTGNANIGNIGTGGLITATGNITGANLVTGGLITAIGNVNGANIRTGGLITATGNITGANVITGGLITATGNITGANLVTGGLITATGNITSGNANLGNLATANFFSGSGNNLSNIQSANITGQVANATIAGTVYTNAQPNITSVGTLTSLSVSGNITTGSGSGGNISGVDYITANFFVGAGNNLSNIQAANITGTIANANYAAYAGNVTIAGQSNITSVGTLSSVSVSGNANVGNLNTSGQLNAGDATITGNLTVNGTTIYANVTTLNVKDPIIEQGGTGNSSPLTSNDGKDRGSLLHYYTTTPVDAFMGWDNSNAEFAFGSNVSVTNEVVTFNALGNIRAGNAILGNSVTSNFFIGSGNNLSNIQAANISGSIANANYAAFAGNVTIAGQSNITSVGTLTGLSVSGNANIGNIGTGGLITATGNIAGANVNTGIVSATGNITGANLVTGGLITATGNINGANIRTGGLITATGNITSGNANLGNLATANFFSGNGNALFSIQAANITGSIANANYAAFAGNVTIAGQSNITSVGILTGVSVSGNANIGNIGTGGLITATGNITGANLVTGGLITATGNLTSGNANLGNAATANFFIGSGNNLSNIQAANITGTVANANYSLYAGTVLTNAQPNITSLGTLTSLTVGPNSSIIASGNTGYFRGNSLQGRDGSQTVYLYYGNISGAAGIATDLTVGTSGGNLLVPSGYISVSGNANVGNIGTTALIATGNVTFSGANVSLGNVSNLKITGGSANYLLKTDGAGNLSWTASTGGGGTPAGNTTELQFNDAGSFAGTPGITYDSGNSRLSLKNYTLVGITLGSVTGATTININLGTYVTATATGSVTWTFSNAAPATNASGFILELTNGGAFTQIWPASVKWPSATAPTLTASGVDVLSFITDDAGTTWRGVASMIDSR